MIDSQASCRNDFGGMVFLMRLSPLLMFVDKMNDDEMSLKSKSQRYCALTKDS